MKAAGCVIHEGNVVLSTVKRAPAYLDKDLLVHGVQLMKVPCCLLNVAPAYYQMKICGCIIHKGSAVL